MRLRSLLLAGALLVPTIVPGVVHAAPQDVDQFTTQWVGSWMASAQAGGADSTPPAPGFTDATLRQVVHLTLGGARVRFRLSNAFGTAPLTIPGAHVALSAKEGKTPSAAIRAGSDHALTFNGQASVTIPAGGMVWSDPVDLAVPDMADLAVSLRLKDVPATVTGHPGSRATSYIASGDALDAADLPGAATVTHWYILTGVDVQAPATANAVVVLGDSITDGRDSTTDGNGRWTDALARNLLRGKSPVGVLNAGIGGNRLLLDGIGPRALDRLDRDVLDQTAVRWVIVLEGINDLATALKAAERKEVAATPEAIIDAYRQIIARAHARGLLVYGATILPCQGIGYCAPAMEPNRQKVNAWIRGSGAFDAVIDLDRTLEDPKNPGHLLPEADGGDHLHPGDTGYRLMAEGTDLALFAR
ncbi:SGNH/GDSL hydrolase family protein [Nitrospirillum viridazoti]|uniref:Lysophospholipase L1-like esterase n=1 Tax=Nitrospirillum amazonense TaxID=28077 RepID=A0A560IKJ8_9PROT|nr:SGNH/GDSL hydrolase family protein [Nitrospirillum amazonense]TWB59467.1 lysophospholipase L1-like esterase [Nitrospirillum amazonense]